MDDFDIRWERIQKELGRQMNGDEQPVFSSGRTLFGIRSTAEVKMDEFARQIEEEQRAKRLAAKTAAEAEAAAQETAGTPNAAEAGGDVDGETGGNLSEDASPNKPTSENSSSNDPEEAAS